ncbi:hypothetical protein MCC_02080 [Rickettsia rhipicephali str. 3-7-female6-CWPP]|uniref:Uncharacterized protein n=1 Tax=Rickettsia rhipicephali (strain 3-7-female6-CWPP) TaxID=1105113 RepID=A0AAI8F728_RICR3|nr:hypothetical protein MCC_02080 [Rickettsia rhipicephali str. 3-7-female6-CWPP]
MTYAGRTKIRPTYNNIKKTIRVASLASITTDLKSKPKIIKGRNNPII